MTALDPDTRLRAIARIMRDAARRKDVGVWMPPRLNLWEFHDVRAIAEGAEPAHQFGRDALAAENGARVATESLRLVNRTMEANVTDDVQEGDIAGATFKVKHRVTGEEREVTQQQFEDEHLDHEGFVNVNPLGSIEAQRRYNAPPLDEDEAARLDEEDSPAGEGDTDFDSWTVEDLKAKAEADGVTVKRGRGEDGAPLKADYVRVLRREERKARQA